jgi:hypothetical protein
MEILVILKEPRSSLLFMAKGWEVVFQGAASYSNLESTQIAAASSTSGSKPAA